jgi:hypothetical protein
MSKTCKPSSSMGGNQLPRDIATAAFTRILQSLSNPLDVANMDINYRGKIREEMMQMKMESPHNEVKKFVNSAAIQLARLQRNFLANPSDITAEGHWIGRKQHCNQILSTFEETLICGILTSQRHFGVKITKETVQETARAAYPEKHASFGKDWIKGFLKRNDDIFVLCPKKSMKASRSNEITYDQTLMFCDVFQEMIDFHAMQGTPIHPDTLCNMDETLLRIVRNGKLEIELVPREELTGTASTNDPSVVGSMLVFVTASGVVPYVYFCMKKVGKAKKYPVPNLMMHRSSRIANATSIMTVADSWSETGYMSEDHIIDAISGFSAVMHRHWGQAMHPFILLADNLRQHRTLSTLKLSAQNKIILQMLTPNASHYLQPLDDKLFGIFKDQLETRCRRLCGAASALGFVVKEPLVSVIPEAFDNAFTPLHIRQAWCNVGIWPFQRHLIMERSMKYTHKTAEGKYTTNVTSPMKALAFEVARKVNEEARSEVLRSVDKVSYRTAGIKEKPLGPKTNSATVLFAKTGGRHDLLLEHEQGEKDKRVQIEKEQEERKKEKEERKRKRVEEEERKVERKRQREEKKEAEIRLLRDAECQFEGCSAVYIDTLVRAPNWLSCQCEKFYLCPTHKVHGVAQQLQERHHEICGKR